MDTLNTIRDRLQVLGPLVCELQDDSAKHVGHTGARSGGHFNLSIVSSRFTGLNTLARHRLVYASLGDLMQTRIHALSLQTASPEEAGLRANAT